MVPVSNQTNLRVEIANGNEGLVEELNEQQTCLDATIEKVKQIYAAIGVKNIALKVALSPFVIAFGLVAAIIYGLYLIGKAKNEAADLHR
ncbi:MAG TPA: hypothetical protein VLG76_03480 [Rhabdochlamydiaceae bacterium]|nr:hypothetical protein [Rhabdochlamydiaceae bacterium]